MELTWREKHLLRAIGQACRYPVARFELHSDSSEELVMTCLLYTSCVKSSGWAGAFHQY